MCAARAASGPCGLGGRLLARAVRAGWHRPPVRTGSVLPAGGYVAAAAAVCCFCFFGHAPQLLFLRSVGLVLLSLPSAALASSVLICVFFPSASLSAGSIHTDVLPPSSERFTIHMRGVAFMLRPPTKGWL